MEPAETSKQNGDLGLDGMASSAPIQSTNSGVTRQSSGRDADDRQDLPLVDMKRARRLQERLTGRL